MADQKKTRRQSYTVVIRLVIYPMASNEFEAAEAALQEGEKICKAFAARRPGKLSQLSRVGASGQTSFDARIESIEPLEASDAG